MLYQLLKMLIIAAIAVFLGTTIFYLIKYISMRKKYGTGTKMFLAGVKLPGIIPESKSPKYEKYKNLLLAAGWTITVERFYIIKCCMGFMILVISLMVVTTNSHTAIGNIRGDINYGRSMIDIPLETTEELMQIEEETLLKVDNYLKSVNLTPNSPLALGSVEAFLRSEQINYDTPSILAKRMLMKVEKMQVIETNAMTLLMIIVIALVGYLVPNILLAVKLELIRNNRDWEMLHCMTTYSIVGRLPPYRVDTVIENMQDVSKIYANYFEIFKDAIYRNDRKEVERIINNTTDEDLAQVFETLALASEIGVNKTVDNIDDLIDTKIKWLEVNAQRKRQMKFMLAFIPVAVVLMLLYIYALQGLNMLNQLMVIDF